MWTQNLNPEQLEAVQRTEGPLLVLAGAGSGKTRVITHRMACLIQEKGASPGSILAVTFTNKAAGEMKRRVSDLVGYRGQEVWVSTFHSAGAKILRSHAKLLGRTPAFSIYDEADQNRLLTRCVEGCGYDTSDFPLPNLRARVEYSKNRLKDLGGGSWDARSQEVQKILQRYEEQLLLNNAFDFGDLIVGVVRLFKENPEVLQQYQQRFQYILVDEFQDTNPAQYLLLRQFADSHRNLCVVGDDDQSIYRWRGADVSNILRFEEDFEGAHLIRLEQNYRSTQNILGAANGLIAKNTSRKGKTLWTSKGVGSPVEIFSFREDRMEARWVADRITDGRQNQGQSYSDIAIFYRTNAQSRLFEEELRRQRIPYTLLGGMEFYERAEVKDIMAYLCWIVNPEDSLSLRRIINVPARGLGKGGLAILEGLAAEKGTSLHSALPLALSNGLLSNKAATSVAAFLKMGEEWRSSLSAISPYELVNKVLLESGYLKMLEEANTEESMARVENLQEFLNAVQEFQEETQSASIADFLQQLALTTSQDRNREERGVWMMTLHIAKGLEFDVVFMVGMEEGLFPHVHSLDDWEELEEERRLCYVGMTRARERLALSHCLWRRIYGQERPARRSRFLAEIPGEFTRKGGLAPAVFEEPKREIVSDGEACDWEIGVRVRHPLYGVGVIRGTEGKSESLKVSIHFPQTGMKKFLVRYAQLQRA
ncbi:MAG: UvrD-helicase domain-containing protein [Deltaproteobacteria bacterium]|nr:UvrD-helicase domain-containing protein [Deltaproteobacteria bacterium]